MGSPRQFHTLGSRPNDGASQSNGPERWHRSAAALHEKHTLANMSPSCFGSRTREVFHEGFDRSHFGRSSDLSGL